MSDPGTEFTSVKAPQPQRVILGPWTGVARFGDFQGEYTAATTGLALNDRDYRGLLCATGADRLTWLSNLVTNQIKTLEPGQGAYAFALNAQGRILFDLNILVRPDELWLDVDRRWIPDALNHLNKYLITEDVTLVDRTADFVRLGLTGSGLREALPRLSGGDVGCGLLRAAKCDIAGCPTSFVRSDFGGALGIELFVPADRARRVFDTLVDGFGAAPVGFDVVDTLRIEHAIPWPISEINDDVLPAETGQFSRAVSHTKGCYLGQEIVERMRSRNVVARRLTLLRISGDLVPPANATLAVDGIDVGRVTSARLSPKNKAPVALAYVRAEHATPGESLTSRWDSQVQECTVLDPPEPREPATS